MTARQLDLVVALEFDRFWASYPARRGGNPKHPARLKFEAAVRYGASAEHIIAAAAHYAQEQAQLKHVGTEYVAQARTWLSQRRWEDYPAPAAEEAAKQVWICMDDPRWPQAVAAYRALKGKTPPTVGGLGGPGWHFDATLLMSTRRPETTNPARVAAERGSNTRSMDTHPEGALSLACFGIESNTPGSPAADWQEQNAGSGAPIPSRATMPATPERS